MQQQRPAGCELRMQRHEPTAVVATTPTATTLYNLMQLNIAITCNVQRRILRQCCVHWLWCVAC